jgi:hypothetical protein
VTAHTDRIEAWEAKAKIGAKTYGGEKDSGRLQVHLTAVKAVKQTRYVN